jgi:predicted lipid-binding transport protein (Tim44 family)
MKKLMISAFLACLALGFSAGDAQAARMGSGKSMGMQRQSVAPRPATPAQAAPAPAPTPPAAAPAPAPKRNWLGPLAGLAAGFGIAALFSQLGLGADLANFFMLALLALAALLIFKLLFRRKLPAVQSAGEIAPRLEYAASTPSTLPPTRTTGPAGGPQPLSAPNPAQLPEGFDSQTFLQIAKRNFIRLQAANDAKNIDDIREFTCPEVFAEIRMQMDERGDEHMRAPQKTEVVSLEAELLEVCSEGQQHIASVRFSGMIRETAGAAATPFCEIWNLSKPTVSGQGWVIAGIQQSE